MSLTVEKPNQLKKKNFSTFQDHNAKVLFKNSDRCVNRKVQCNIKPAYQKQ